MAAQMHAAWTWVRIELGVGVLALLLLFVPLLLALRRRRRRRTGWNTFAEEFDSSADGVFEEKVKHGALMEWLFLPLLFVGVAGFWIGIPRLRSLQCVQRGNELGFGSQVPKAIEWYRKALQFNPDNALAHHGLATLYFDQGKRDEARREFDAALRLDPDNALFHRDLGVLWLQYGNSDDALLEYYRAAALDPEDSDIHAEFARLLVANGKLDEAIAQYRIALRYSHDPAELHYSLANTLLMQGKSDAALAQYAQFLDLNPSDARANNNYGVLLYAAKRFPEAETFFRKAATLDDQYAEAFFNLGRAAQKTGHDRQAIEAYRSFLPLGAKSPEFATSILAARKQLHRLDPRRYPAVN